MKLSIFSRFGALNSVPVLRSFIVGALRVGHTVVEHDLNADAYVIWSVLWHGRMKSNREIWNHAKKTGKPLIILEVGGLCRGTTWRLGLNHINNLGKFSSSGSFDSDRPAKLGIKLEKQKIQGQNILICGQHSKSEQWAHRPAPEIWLTTLITKIKEHSDRQIVFRPHPRDYEWCQFLPKLGIDIKIPKKTNGTYDDFNHEEDFLTAWTVINPCSNPGVQAAIAGIPIFVEKDSLAFPVSNKSYNNLENPEIFDREEWLIRLCHTEWTLDELESGSPILNLL